MMKWPYSIFFFFSSRRRHTICYRDWSSDVCSSDLDGAGGFTCSPSTPGLPPGSYPYWDAAVGDFNGDGKADLAVVGAGTAVAVFLGGATGFTTYVSYPLLDIDFATSVVVADFNRDGK